MERIGLNLEEAALYSGINEIENMNYETIKDPVVHIKLYKQ